MIGDDVLLSAVRPQVCQKSIVCNGVKANAPCIIATRRRAIVLPAVRDEKGFLSPRAKQRKPASYSAATGRRSRSACASVPGSTYSSSPPTGTPRARRLTARPRAFMSSPM
jgi:hypothetical protein